MDSFLSPPPLAPIQGLLATQLMSCGSDLSWDFAQEFREPGEGGELDEACLRGLSSTVERLTGVALPVAVRPLAPIPEQEVDEDAWHDILGDARALAMIGWEGEWFSVVGLRGWSRALEDLRERMACNALAYEGPFKQIDRPSLDTRERAWWAERLSTPGWADFLAQLRALALAQGLEAKLPEPMTESKRLRI